MKEGAFLNPGSERAGRPGPLTELISKPAWQLILLIAFTTLLCGVKLDSGGLMKYDECYYAQKAKEMSKTGDWLTPRFAGVATHDNPPGHIWVLAASYRVFGVGEWAARFPTVLQTVLIVVITFFIARWLFGGAWVPFTSASGLLICDYFYKFSRKAHMDHLMTLLFLAALSGFLAGKRRNQWWYLLMGGAVGYAVLTKSVLGLFSIISIFIYIIIKREWLVLRKPMFWAGCALSLSMVFSWYGYEYNLFGDRFLHIHVGWLIYGRSLFGGAYGGAGTGIAGVPLKIVENLYLFLRDAHIWLVFGLAGVVLYFRECRGKGVSTVTETMSGDSLESRDALRDKPRSPRGETALFAIAAITPIIIMSFAGEFKSWYLMPVFPLLSLFTFFCLSRSLGSERRMRTVSFVILALLIVHLSVLVVAPIFSLDMKHEIRNPGIRKLANKVRMLDPPYTGRTALFPASDSIAGDNGLGASPFYYPGIANPWNFYSDSPLQPRKKQLSLEEVRYFLKREGGVCLTTGRGFKVLSDGGERPFRVMARAYEDGMDYVICCSHKSYNKWRGSIETDFSRPPLYSRREY